MSVSHGDHIHDDLAAGLTRPLWHASLLRSLLLNPAYPRLKFFRPKLRLSRLFTPPLDGPGQTTAKSAGSTAAAGRRKLPALRPHAFPYLTNCMAGVVLFRVYDTTAFLLRAKEPEDSTTVISEGRAALSGLIAGAMHGAIAHPTEMLQNQHHIVRMSHLVDAWTSRSFRNSMHLTILRDGVGFAVFFCAYESVRTWLSAKLRPELSSLGIVAGAVVATTGHHMISFPSDALKDHFHRTKQQPTFRLLVQTVLQQNTALFQGARHSLLRLLPGGTLCFMTYEAMLRPETVHHLGETATFSIAGAARMVASLLDI